MKLNKFSEFKIKSLQKINGGKALAAFYTIVVTDCGSDNEDSYEDKDTNYY